MSKNIVNIQGDVDCNKINIIDNIKTIMMLAVVFYHSCCFFTGNWFDVVEPVYKSNIITHIAYWQYFSCANFYDDIRLFVLCIKKKIRKI